MTAERLALVKRYADAMWRDLPDFKFAPAWALRPWIEAFPPSQVST